VLNQAPVSGMRCCFLTASPSFVGINSASRTPAPRSGSLTLAVRMSNRFPQIVDWSCFRGWPERSEWSPREICEIDSLVFSVTPAGSRSGVRAVAARSLVSKYAAERSIDLATDPSLSGERVLQRTVRSCVFDPA